MGVTLSLVWLTLCDRHTGARHQRVRQERACQCRFRYGVVGPAAGRDQIPARKRGLGTKGLLQPRCLRHGACEWPARLRRVLRRRSIACGQGRYSQHVVGGG